MKSKLKMFYKTLSCLTLMFMFVLCNPITALASNNGAVSDIMSSDRFEGAMQSIEWLTIRIDTWFTMIITVIAFLIISVSLLKNVFAGAYCANPKLWNKVDEAHKANEGLTLANLGSKFKDNVMNKDLKTSILLFIPNLKAATDFDDQEVSPKQYFMKSIPQMCLCIIIGIFIYNGYYRDTAMEVGNFGTEILDRVFSSVDATSFVSKVTQTTGTPDNIFANSSSRSIKNQYEISMALYKSVVSSTNTAEGLSTADKTAIMRSCELVAQNIVTKNMGTNYWIYEGVPKEYKLTIKCTPMDGADVSDALTNEQSYNYPDGQSCYTKSDNAGSFTCRMVVPADKLGVQNTVQVDQTNYAGLVINITAKAADYTGPDSDLDDERVATGDLSNASETYYLTLPVTTFRDNTGYTCGNDITNAITEAATAAGHDGFRLTRNGFGTSTVANSYRARLGELSAQSVQYTYTVQNENGEGKVTHKVTVYVKLSDGESSFELIESDTEGESNAPTSGNTDVTY